MMRPVSKQDSTLTTLSAFTFAPAPASPTRAPCLTTDDDFRSSRTSDAGVLRCARSSMQDRTCVLNHHFAVAGLQATLKVLSVLTDRLIRNELFDSPVHGGLSPQSATWFAIPRFNAHSVSARGLQAADSLTRYYNHAPSTSFKCSTSC